MIKAFNTMDAGTLVAGNPLAVCVLGDDADAKATRSRLVEAGGLHTIDGDHSRSPQIEALGLLHNNGTQPERN